MGPEGDIPLPGPFPPFPFGAPPFPPLLMDMPDMPGLVLDGIDPCGLGLEGGQSKRDRCDDTPRRPGCAELACTRE
jgi:hypothetical protein